MLHDEKNLFEQLILRTSDAFEIERGIVEKDYYVPYFSKPLHKKNRILSSRAALRFQNATTLSIAFRKILI